MWNPESLFSLHENDFGQIIGLNIKLKTMKRLKENARGNIRSLRLNEDDLRTLKEH